MLAISYSNIAWFEMYLFSYVVTMCIKTPTDTVGNLLNKLSETVHK